MGIMDKYVASAPTMASEEPSNTIEAGKYIGEVVGGKCALREGTSNKTGEPYRFGEVNLQIRVSEGPKKGQNFFVKPNLGYEAGSDDEANKRRLYFVQHTYDAMGFGRKLDPSWKKAEVPHPTKAGKTITTFSGRVLTKDQVADICASEEDSADLLGLLKGCVGRWTVSEDDVTTTKGDIVKVNNLKNVEAITDANLAKWRSEGSSSGSAAPAATSGSRYA